jgi:hypothetical protein
VTQKVVKFTALCKGVHKDVKPMHGWAYMNQAGEDLMVTLCARIMTSYLGLIRSHGVLVLLTLFASVALAKLKETFPLISTYFSYFSNESNCYDKLVQFITIYLALCLCWLP